MSCKKRRIGVDCDDVVIDFNEGLAKYHNKRYGTTYGRKDITSYELEGNLWDCDLDEAIQRIHDFYHSEEHTALLPTQGAVKALNRLKKSYSLILITSRPESVRALTSKLLEKHFPLIFDDAHFLGCYHKSESRGQTKAEVCKTRSAFVYLLKTPWRTLLLWAGRVFLCYSLMLHGTKEIHPQT